MPFLLLPVSGQGAKPGILMIFALGPDRLACVVVANSTYSIATPSLKILEV